MRKFVARQPILDCRKNVFAYELLFRSGMEDFFRSDQPDQATSSVMVSSFLLFGIEALTGGRKAFLNFTYNLLVQNFATLLPREQAVIEILEDVQPDEHIMAACRALKQKGYLLALDDFVLTDQNKPLITIADIVKVDFLATPPEACRRLAQGLAARGIKLLAEKVETHEQFRAAIAMGFTYFQGFFFCRPEIVSGRDIPAYKPNYLSLLQEVNKREPDFFQIERVIEREPSLSYKLLRYLNSAAFCFRGNITSIRHAFSLLGLQELCKWVSLVVLAGMGREKPAALIMTSVTRAKFCEGLGHAGRLAPRSSELFLLGLFSVLDAVLDRPMQDLLVELPISEDIKAALLGEETCLHPVYGLVKAYENNDWLEVCRLAALLHLSEEAVTDAYLVAIQWAHKIYQSEKARPPV